MKGRGACGRAREERRTGQAGGLAVNNRSALGARRSALGADYTAPVNPRNETNVRCHDPPLETPATNAAWKEFEQNPPANSRPTAPAAGLFKSHGAVLPVTRADGSVRDALPEWRRRRPVRGGGAVAVRPGEAIEAAHRAHDGDRGVAERGVVNVGGMSQKAHSGPRSGKGVALFVLDWKARRRTLTRKLADLKVEIESYTRHNADTAPLSEGQRA